MSKHYTVRRLLTNADAPLRPHWCGGDAFSSAVFEALSMSFPRGEQYFIDSLKAGAQCLAPAERAAFAEELRGFIGQEATHRQVHRRFNQQLTALGYQNHIEARIERRIQRLAALDVRRHVAATAATEHITALLAFWLLRNPSVLAGAPPAAQSMWLWHSTEEIEHRSTAFDLYRAIGGHEAGRKQAFWYVSLNLFTDLALQVASNLWRNGAWKRARTWTQGLRLMWGPDGLLRGNLRGWWAYRRPDFHPSQQDSPAAARWLAENAALWRTVGAPQTIGTA